MTIQSILAMGATYVIVILNLILIWAFAGLPVIPTESENDASVQLSRQKKLVLSPELSLPHPITLDNWDNSGQNLPDLLPADTEDYFRSSEYFN